MITHQPPSSYVYPYYRQPKNSQVKNHVHTKVWRSQIWNSLASKVEWSLKPAGKHKLLWHELAPLAQSDQHQSHQGVVGSCTVQLLDHTISKYIQVHCQFLALPQMLLHLKCLLALLHSTNEIAWYKAIRLYLLSQ